MTRRYGALLGLWEGSCDGTSFVYLQGDKTADSGYYGQAPWGIRPLRPLGGIDMASFLTSR
jgi:hypothetical protein